MEGLLLFVLIIVLIIVITTKSAVSSNIRIIDHKLDDLSRQIQRLQLEQSESRKEKEGAAASQHSVKAARPTLEEVREREEELRREKLRQEDQREEQRRREAQEALRKEQENEERRQATQQTAQASTPAFSSTPQKQVQPQPGFFERNPDLEKFIGENLANKIGIAILVIGIGFFVKYAIDQNWINPIGRVFIGILCGGILLGVAHRLRKTFAPFSSVLVGGGIAVLYFTIAIAFHEYHIFSQTIAFIIMVAITAFTIFLSLGYNRVELAVLAILGGFGAPFMVSTGEGNYVVLFTYVVILNSGMLVLAYYKKWRIVNVICYLFTIILFGGWMTARFVETNIAMIRGSLIFATIFYLIFFVMNIVNNLKERSKFEALEIMMLLSNTFLYYGAGMYILNSEVGENFRGLFTVLLGVFNFGFAFALYRNSRADKNLVFMLIGLVLTFVSLAAPIQLDGNYITLFWAAETVLLLWLSQKSGIRLFTIASVIIQFLMVVSLLMDWKQIYLDVNNVTQLTIFLNKGYITSVVSIASMIGVMILLKKQTDETVLDVKLYRVVLTIAIGLFVYVANLLELRHQLAYYLDSYSVSTIIVGCYNMFFILGLLLWERELTLPPDLKKVFAGWGVIALCAYSFYYHGVVIDARNAYLEGTAGISAIVFHYVLVALLIMNVVLSLRKINARKGLAEALNQAHWWIYIFFFVFLASAELDHIVVMATYATPDHISTVLEENHKIGFPILWGITSFILIAVGLQRKIKMIRIISMVLLLVTLLKLFIIDLRDISEGGKIAAFISLGVLLLVVSFMYQRLKRLLLEGSQETSEEKKETV